jgi:hypothetical protein
VVIGSQAAFRQCGGISTSHFTSTPFSFSEHAESSLLVGKRQKCVSPVVPVLMVPEGTNKVQKELIFNFSLPSPTSGKQYFLRKYAFTNIHNCDDYRPNLLRLYCILLFIYLFILELCPQTRA